MHSTAAQLIAQVRDAGYRFIRIDQLRTNRWILTISDPSGAQILVLAQQRPLISSSDVQDLAELLRLGRISSGFLLAVGGRFSQEAQRTATELRQPHIQLCNALPATSLLKHSAPVLETA